MNSITGLIIRNETVEWTVLREDKTGAMQSASKSVTFDLSESDAQDSGVVASGIRSRCPELTGSVTVGIASDQVLMSVVELPTVDGSEIVDMVQLQVDKLSPFPGDRMASSFEVLELHETSCRVLITTVRRSVIERIGEICTKAGLVVHRMDLEVMGWWRLLCDANAVLQEGRQMTILMEQDGGVIIASWDGIPLAFKSIAPAEGLPEDEYAAEIAGETSALNLALDLEHGESPVSETVFVHHGPEPECIVGRLREEFGGDMQVSPLASLPPLSKGLAARFIEAGFSTTGASPGLRGTKSVIDFVPTAWRTAAAASQLKRRMIAAFAAVLGAWIIGMAALSVGHGARQRRLNQAEQRMAQLQGPADEVRALQRRVNSFEQYLDRTRSVLECLLEIDGMRPSEVKLTSFQFKKGRNALIRGESLVVDQIIDYKQQLDESDLFETIEMGAIQPRKRKDQTVQTFHMNARLPE